jgi:ribulose-phosphate 3-epimerase
LGDHVTALLWKIKSLGKKVGLAVNPPTAVAQLIPHLAHIDTLLVMTVNPGFGGQKFLPLTFNKIRQAKELIKQAGSNTLIEIDGGVTLENATEIVAAGADVLVAGNTVFSSPDPLDIIKRLKQVGK